MNVNTISFALVAKAKNRWIQKRPKKTHYYCTARRFRVLGTEHVSSSDVVASSSEFGCTEAYLGQRFGFWGREGDECGIID